MRTIHWLNLPTGLLIALLQRTPVLRLVSTAGEIVVSFRAGLLLKSLLPTAAALGAVQTLAGATVITFRQGTTVTNPVNATVGTPISPIGATVTGAGVGPAGSWDFSNNLPPGLTVTGAGVQNNLIVLNGAFFTITGTPTTAGTYVVTVGVWQKPNLSGNRATASLTFNVGGGAPTAPSITTHPVSQTVVAGTSVTFAVTAASGSALSYQWLKDGAAIAGATSQSLTLTNVPLTAAGNYTVRITNSAGTTTSNAATLVVRAPVGTLAMFTTQPRSVVVTSGATVALTAIASGTAPLAYQWTRNGEPVPGATGATLVLTNTTTGDGSYAAVVSNSAGTVSSNNATVAVVTGTVSRISNLSVRTNIGTGQTLFVGFVTDGAKPVLVRGVGPGMATAFPQFFGPGDVMADPRLELYNAGGALVDGNDNWSSNLAAAMVGVGAFPLTVGSQDATLLASINGQYTAQLKGTGNGVVLVDAYDTTNSFAPRLKNVSARNLVGTDNNILIAGFVIDATDNRTAKTVLVRGIGPALRDVFNVSGQLADPKLEIYDGNGAKVVENDDWSPALTTYFDLVGAYRFLPGSKDAALLVTLPPGAYTVWVSGVGGTTGDGVAEAYEVP